MQLTVITSFHFDALTACLQQLVTLLIQGGPCMFIRLEIENIVEKSNTLIINQMLI